MTPGDLVERLPESPGGPRPVRILNLEVGAVRRSLLICVLMMTLSLSACGGGGGGSEAEELALTIRGEYLAMTSCAAQAVVTADYGQRVYRYELSAAVNGEEALLTLTAPETVAGLTARIEEDEGWLEYDGAILETGELAPGGLTPMGAIPALLEPLGPAIWTPVSWRSWGKSRPCGW